MSEKAYRTFLATAVGGIFLLVAWVVAGSPLIEHLRYQIALSQIETERNLEQEYVNALDKCGLYHTYQGNPDGSAEGTACADQVDRNSGYPKDHWKANF